jgi:hypothetical protein
VADENSGLAFLSNMTRQRQKVVLNGTRESRIIIKMNSGNFDKISRIIQLPLPEWQGKMVAIAGEHVMLPYETLIVEYRL